jgi:hypothetical protein
MSGKRGYFICFVLSLVLCGGLVSANTLEIDVGDAYSPGEEVIFRVKMFDDSGKEASGRVNFAIQDRYAKTVSEGILDLGQESGFKLPKTASPGYWTVEAKAKNVQEREFFNVVEIEKADIKLEGEELVIINVGNVPYSSSLQIIVGEHKEDIFVSLDVGEIKKIKLGARESGEYTIRVSDGTKENTLEFSGVVLTGSVVGADKQKNSLMKNPVASLFLVTLLATTLIILGLRMYPQKQSKEEKIR